jgi:hypothetical protein
MMGLAACGASSPAPKGWQPVPGASGAWSTGEGAVAQQYFYAAQSFGGTLQDLASRITIDVLMRRHGAKLRGSIPFAPCPGAAGLATFVLPERKTLEEGFAVRNGQAVRASYLRPSGTPVDPSVTDAMQRVLCAL